MGETEGPQTQVGGSVGNGFQHVFNRMDRLVDHNVAKRATVFVVTVTAFVDRLSANDRFLVLSSGLASAVRTVTRLLSK